MIDLSIVVLSWNTRELVLDCLESIERERLRPDFPLTSETILVDNASCDGTTDAVAANFPDVRILGLPANVGFAAGCNAGLREIGGRHALLLNSDARVLPGALARCVRFLDSHPEVGIVGPQLRHPDGSRQNSIHNAPRLATELLPRAVFQFLFRRRFPSRRWVGPGPLEVEAVNGAAIFCRARVVREVGPLCEDYFFFLEETDWCLRVRNAGWRVVHLPDAEFVHESGASSKRRYPSVTRIEYHRSLYRYYRKFRGRSPMALAIALRFAKAACYVVSHAPLAVFSPRQRTRWKAHCAVLAWHLRGCPGHLGLVGVAGSGEAA